MHNLNMYLDAYLVLYSNQDERPRRLRYLIDFNFLNKGKDLIKYIFACRETNGGDTEVNALGVEVIINRR